VKEKFKLAIWFNSESYENILDDPNSNIWRFFDLCILFLTIFIPFILIFESIWNNSIRYWTELIVFDSFISSVFLLEYIYRFYCSRRKIKFLITPARIIDLLSFLPFFLWAVTLWNFLKLLRITRLLRVLRPLKRIPLTDRFIKSLKNFSYEYRAVFTLYALILFFGSFFVYYIEKDLPWTNFTSIWIALWWWLVTMSTVWYWDMIPVSDAWKMIWSILVFIWPIIWSLIWAVTIMVFMESSEDDNIISKHTKFKECNRCRTANPRIANFCMKCGEWFYIKD